MVNKLGLLSSTEAQTPTLSLSSKFNAPPKLHRGRVTEIEEEMGRWRGGGRIVTGTLLILAFNVIIDWTEWLSNLHMDIHIVKYTIYNKKTYKYI